MGRKARDVLLQDERLTFFAIKHKRTGQYVTNIRSHNSSSPRIYVSFKKADNIRKRLFEDEYVNYVIVKWRVEESTLTTEDLK